MGMLSHRAQEEMRKNMSLKEKIGMWLFVIFFIAFIPFFIWFSLRIIFALFGYQTI